MDRRTFACSLWLLPLYARAADDPEVTEDGLVRVPSSRKAGVYRAPGISFAHYRRVSFGDIPIAFQRDWARKNPDFKAPALERLRGELVQMFREELLKELVERGGYALTDARDPDVLRVDPSVMDLDIVAPNAGNVPGASTLVRVNGSMKLVIELRDAASGVLVARIIDYEQGRDSGQLRLVNQMILMDDLRDMFASGARQARNALNVAKTRREP